MNKSLGPPDERSLVSTRLLLALVNNPLDPGYAEAAKHRTGGKRWYDKPAVALGCLLIGFLLVVAYVHTHRSEPQAQKVHDGLVARVRAAEHATADLAKQVDSAQQRLDAEQDAALPNGRLARALDADQLAAGQTAVHGPGLVVTLRDPPVAKATPTGGRGGTIPITQTNSLTDRDVRSVVNELWRDGAEAIAVNGVRVTPTSAIRFAGQAVLVDFQPISSPYSVTALGDADGLATGFASSAVASRYQTLKGVQHIGFGFTEQGDLHLPAAAPVTPRFAKAGRK